jgi:hypothetical protein
MFNNVVTIREHQPMSNIVEQQKRKTGSADNESPLG